MNLKKTYWLTLIAIIGTAFLFFQFFYPYHLFFKEQIQLFLYTPGYLSSYFKKPAGLACLSGDFLTQFFYLRGGGPLVLALLFVTEWLLVGFVLKKGFLTKNPELWALIPVAADFTSHLDLLYTPANSMGFILLLSFFLLLLIISDKTFFLISTLLVAVFGHWLLGNAVFLLPFLLFFRKDQKKPVFASLLVLLIVLLLPFFTRLNYLLTLKQVYLYPAFNWKGFFLPVTFVMVLIFLKIFSVNQNHKAARSFVPICLLLLVTAGGFRMNAAFGLEKILALDSETYFGNTEKILKLVEKKPVRNRFGSYYTNMALAQNGELPEKLLEFYQPAAHGLILPVSQYESWKTILFSNELFYLLGDMNLAQHSAMLGNTFSPYNRSSRMMKRLAEVNMVNEDYPGAEKFLRMLEETLFHKKWAEQRLTENHPGSQSRWLTEKRKQIAHTDTIRNSLDYVQSVEFLVRQNPGNRIALDYLLCSHLLNKNLAAFKAAYDHYAKPLNLSVQKVYGEALLIILFRAEASETNIREYNIHPEILKDFLNYTRNFEQTKAGMQRLKDKFGTSYWYYYHFASIKEGKE